MDHTAQATTPDTSISAPRPRSPAQEPYAIRTLNVRNLYGSLGRVSVRRCSMSELFDAVDALVAS
ncbi:hypothetical protein, partial [Streptomyces sp. NPDC054787]